MEWVKGGGWHVLAKPPEYDGTNYHTLKSFQISEDLLIILISNTE